MEIYYAILLFVIGTILGSFYTVVATRLPEHKSIIKPGSHCDNCGKPLKFYELIPILSYFILGRKCPKCKCKIDITSTLVELVLGLSFMASYLYFGFSYEFFIMLVLTSLVLIIFVSDFKYMIILDSPLIVAAIIIFGLKVYYLGIFEALYSVLAGLIVFGLIYLIKILGDKAFKEESLGGGDIKFSALMGLTLGIKLGLLSFAMGAFIAFPVALFYTIKKKDHAIPFGPFLVLGLVITFIFGKYILHIIGIG